MPRIRAGSIRAHKAQTRAALLEAAFKVFATAGYGSARLGDVAALAGVGRTTLYDYFPGKEDLFLAVLEDRVPPLLDQAIRDRSVTAAPAAGMAALFATAIELVVEHRELSHLLFRVGRELPVERRDQMWRVLDPALAAIGALCVEMAGPGDAPGLARTVADVLVGSIDELLDADDVAVAAPQVLATRLRFLERGLSHNVVTALTSPRPG